MEKEKNTKDLFVINEVMPNAKTWNHLNTNCKVIDITNIQNKDEFEKALNDKTIYGNVELYNEFFANTKAKDIAPKQEQIHVLKNMDKESQDFHDYTKYAKADVIDANVFNTVTKDIIYKEGNPEFIYLNDLKDELGNNGNEDDKLLLNRVLNIYVKENVSKEIYFVYEQNDGISLSVLLDSINVFVEKNAKVWVKLVVLSDIKKYIKFNIHLQEGAHVESRVALVADNSSYTDMIYTSTAYDCDCISHFDMQSIQFKESFKDFKGNIYFTPYALRADGTESEQTTLFSENAVSKSSPILLCACDDVNGEHASSFGKIEKDEIFYLTSRGLSEDAAKSVIIFGRLKSTLGILDNIQKAQDEKDEVLKAKYEDIYLQLQEKIQKAFNDIQK